MERPIKLGKSWFSVKYICATCSGARKRHPRESSERRARTATPWRCEPSLPRNGMKTCPTRYPIRQRRCEAGVGPKRPGAAPTDNGGAPEGKKAPRTRTARTRVRTTDEQQRLTEFLIRRDSRAWGQCVLPRKRSATHPKQRGRGQWVAKDRGHPFLLHAPRRLVQATYGPSME